MIILCPSCSKESKATSIDSHQTLHPSKLRIIHYKRIYCVCDPCSKPLTHEGKTEFMIKVDKEKL